MEKHGVTEVIHPVTKSPCPSKYGPRLRFPGLIRLFLSEVLRSRCPLLFCCFLGGGEVGPARLFFCEGASFKPWPP